MKNTFNKNLAAYRKRRGLSQRELAKKLGVSHRTIAYYESETNSIPLDKLEEIARILNINSGALISNDNDSTKQFENIDLRLVKKLIEIKKLPDRDQRAISNYINALIERNKNKQRESSS
jgi:transcriptional regulator with XRE-family HTH domain